MLTREARVNILGVGVSPINMRQALERIDEWIVHRTPHYVCVTPVSSLVTSHYEPSVKSIFNHSGLVTPDGMPLVWLLRSQGYQHVERVSGRDLMNALCQHSQRAGYRHFFYGGAEGVPEELASRLQARFPALNVVGTHSPPFRALTPAEDRAIIEQINAAQPDIVWVGLGAPKQERWMAEHVGKIEGAVLIGVGAVFDFLTGRKKIAPPWMQQAGLEWLFRLITEPRRLAKRYLVGNPLFVWLLLMQLSGLQPFEMDREHDDKTTY